LRPRIGLLLNVTPDHLDRHGSLAEYIECKYRLFDRQDESDSAVLGYDDPLARRASSRGRGQKFYFSDVERVKGAYVSRGWLCFEGARVARADGTRLAGRHNRLNALAAMCAARLAGAGPNAIRRGLVGFGGLPHRLELVRVRRGVSFVNNSMCTNPAAAVRSLQAFDRRVVLIAGGRNKGLPLEPYADEIVRRASWAVLIGEVRDRLARELATRGFNRFETSPSLREAVGLAAGRARRGDTVLFSPGFASFDMFRDFRDRGRRFSNEARRLP
jgi:UDP-N-acetylmuramoylalanine--D-glutamate ligase